MSTAVAQNGPSAAPMATWARANQATIHAGFARHHAETEKCRTRDHPAAGDERASAPDTERVRKPAGEPAAERHAERKRELQGARVVFARGFAEVQDFVEVELHPINKEILEVPDGGVAQRDQEQAAIGKERGPSGGVGCRTAHVSAISLGSNQFLSRPD